MILVSVRYNVKEDMLISRCIAIKRNKQKENRQEHKTKKLTKKKFPNYKWNITFYLTLSLPRNPLKANLD